jgi:hypothetical protein
MFRVGRHRRILVVASRRHSRRDGEKWRQRIASAKLHRRNSVDQSGEIDTKLHRYSRQNGLEKININIKENGLIFQAVFYLLNNIK